MGLILHITTRESWREAQAAGVYRADSLESEGFIHCSTAAQVLGPANAMFKGQSNLILLVIDEERVDANIVYEDCYESGTQFPHIYGPLEMQAVVRLIDFPCSADGTFVLPAEVAELGM